ncbi:hypothetical protein CALVIDRAFT_596436 [Calocera viscosa TUFC12733]|uniref:Uncharacterized protein n=1 Tax=Calocera viscosa (strain TUFC12733) TaxID=1330018 RepID=A0A167PI28_CALVF|nr:hypothetical protein CALVIDRAFT_596436 [Calocera viscosa TUFC12733]
MSSLVALSQLPLGALYALSPEWALPVSIGEGCLLYMYADCYPSSVPFLAGSTLLRTLLLLSLSSDPVLVAQTLVGLAVGLFLGNCVAGGERDGQVCLGCLSERWWDGGLGGAKGLSGWGWGGWQLGWRWEWDELEERALGGRREGEEPFWVWEEPF